jgi:hypothetical protein
MPPDMKQLKDRLQKEKGAMSEEGPLLQQELSKVGDELSALGVGRQGSKSAAAAELSQMKSRVAALEKRVIAAMTEIGRRVESIQTDLESSLAVTEKKARSLDELYREANAENEALYERFNEELGRVLKAVKGGRGVEEMRTKLKEAQDAAARAMKENQRLKRENLGLRSQLRGE